MGRTRIEVRIELKELSKTNPTEISENQLEICEMTDLLAVFLLRL